LSQQQADKVSNLMAMRVK